MITENEPIKKVNAGYLCANIFLPIVIALGITVFGAIFLDEIGAILGTVAMLGAIFWWAFFARKVYDMGKEKTLAELDATGFYRSHTFNAEGCTVAVDLDGRKIALMFRWNPSMVYIRPASALSEVHAEDGKTGNGIFAGSARVRFVFFVEGVRVNVNTFTSNRRWAMDSEEITTGIRKANTMVDALVSAGARKQFG